LRIGVVARNDRDDAEDVVRTIVEYLHSRDIEVLVEDDVAGKMDPPVSSIKLEEMDADFVITVGGDGTILRAAMEMPDPGTPILGVNMGSRGFLTEVMPADLENSIDRMLEGDYTLEECIKLSSKSPSMGTSFRDALNEVLVVSSKPSKALDIGISVNGKHILDVQADGVLVAPPTGSTAYNLSAGGSILAPGVDGMIVTTLCPYVCFSSVVVPSTSMVELETLKPSVESLTIIDGRYEVPLEPDSVVQIWKSEHKARFIRFKSFYERFKRRLVFYKVRR